MMFPIIVEVSSQEWLDSVLSFSRRLMMAYGGRLKRVIALPSPDQRVYESNVLVVLADYSSEDMDRVVEIALEVDERIVPLVAGEGEEDVVEAFQWAGGKDVEAD